MTDNEIERIFRAAYQAGKASTAQTPVPRRSGDPAVDELYRQGYEKGIRDSLRQRLASTQPAPHPLREPRSPATPNLARSRPERWPRSAEGDDHFLKATEPNEIADPKRDE